MSQTAAALPIHETIYSPDAPRPDQISDWSRLPGTRSYLINAQDPYPDDLMELTKLKGADRLRIETNRYPGEDTVAAWKLLAAMGAEFIALDVGFPTQPEIDRLNRIGFKKLLFVLKGFPGTADSARLNKLNGELAVTFSRGTFPRYDDRDGIIALGPKIHTMYATDLWPWYGHMDVLNFLPQAKTIRVTGLYPSDQHFQYLLAIKGLKDVIVDVEFDPATPDTWLKFGSIPVQWSSKDRVPSAQAIRDFEAYPGAKRLIIDQDYPLSADEVRRLTSSRLPVEWIHTATP